MDERPRRSGFARFSEHPEVKALMDRWKDEAAQPRQERGDEPVPPPEPACARCRDAGYTVRRTTDDHNAPTTVLVPCTCAAATEPRRRRRERLLQGSVLAEPTFDSARFDSPAVPFPNAEQAPYWQMARAWATHPSGFLWLYGAPHTGKTTLALCVGHLWADAGREVVWQDTQALFDWLRDSYGNDEQGSLLERMDLLQQADHLILNELGNEHATAWARAQRFALLDYRLARHLPTVVTTNWQLSDLEHSDWLEERRLFYRVADPEKCLIIPFTNTPISKEAPS